MLRRGVTPGTPLSVLAEGQSHPELGDTAHGLLRSSQGRRLKSRREGLA